MIEKFKEAIDREDKFGALLTELSPLTDRNIQTLAIEIYKLFDGFSPSIMKNIFQVNTNNTVLGHATNFIVEIRRQ